TGGPSISTASPNIRTGSLNFNTVSPIIITRRSNHSQSVSDMFSLGNNATPEASNDDQFGDATELDMSNLNVSYQVPITPHTRINKDHSLEQVIGDIQSRVQTKRMANKERFLSEVYKGKSHEDLNTCLFACFLSQEEPKRITKALSDLAWVEAMQEELLQFKLQNVVDLPKDYDEVFAPVARIEAIRLFLAYASFMGFMVNQIDVKSAFLYGQINEELQGHDMKPWPTICWAMGFKEEGLIRHYSSRSKKEIFCLFRSMWMTLFLDLPTRSYQKQDGIFISQDKYVADILRKFNYTDVKTASTPVDLEKPLVKDGNADDVDVHLYKSMIGSLMYLTTSRPDIMFVVCACARFQVTPKTSHLLAVKIIFRCLKGKSSLGLWYSRDSPFELVAYTDSDYARDTQDRKSTTGGC
ncbi:putative ribonuclease H-like domain-containing protein, partial [Tanacetum coccineum]